MRMANEVATVEHRYTQIRVTRRNVSARMISLFIINKVPSSNTDIRLTRMVYTVYLVDFHVAMHIDKNTDSVPYDHD